MSVQLRVELPAYTLSFIVAVPSSATVLDVKQEIARTCTGQPNVDGQRLIWRGRYLRDSEKVEDIWKTPNEPRIVHLSVHPSAWSATPPTILGSTQSTPVVPPAPTPTSTPSRRTRTSTLSGRSTPSRASSTPSFILYKHQNALLALLEGSTLPAANATSISVERLVAEVAVARGGYSWPAILDEEFPPDDNSSEGVKYACVVHEGQTYLKLLTPDATPTPLQAHALKVLTFTFPLLSLQTPTSVAVPVASQQIPIPPHMNMLLQQLGLPALRGAQQAPVRNVNGAGLALQNIARIPLMPFVMISLRTLVMLYFINPMRKPWLGVALVLWMAYDFAAPFLAAIRNAGTRQAAAAAQAGGVAQPIAAAPAIQGAAAGAHQAALDTLANVNLADEDRALAGVVPHAPSLLHKIGMFLSLLVTTAHPAVWDRRRAALRRREGTIRTEANAREATVPDNEAEEGGGEGVAGRNVENDRTRAARDNLAVRHALRPHWVRAYIERVRGGGWVDDSD